MVASPDMSAASIVSNSHVAIDDPAIAMAINDVIIDNIDDDRNPDGDSNMRCDEVLDDDEQKQEEEKNDPGCDDDVEDDYDGDECPILHYPILAQHRSIRSESPRSLRREYNVQEIEVSFSGHRIDECHRTIDANCDDAEHDDQQSIIDADDEAEMNISVGLTGNMLRTLTTINEHLEQRMIIADHAPLTSAYGRQLSYSNADDVPLIHASFSSLANASLVSSPHLLGVFATTSTFAKEGLHVALSSMHATNNMMSDPIHQQFAIPGAGLPHIPRSFSSRSALHARHVLGRSGVLDQPLIGSYLWTRISARANLNPVALSFFGPELMK